MTARKHVLLLLACGFEELEAAAFTDVLGWSRSDGLEPVDLTVAGLRDEIRGTWSLTVKPDLLISDCRVEQFDALAIPGGFEEGGYYNDAYSDAFLDLIRAFAAAQKPVTAICTGALPLGRSGVLAGRKATTYHLGDSIRLQQLADMPVGQTEKSMIVRDGPFVTSCGPATAVDVAFTLLEMLTSAENVVVVRRAMGFTARSENGQKK